MMAPLLQLRALLADVLTCPTCGRPHRALGLRSGDAWVTCWHRACEQTAWVLRIPAASPIAEDIERVIGPRLAAALLQLQTPATLVQIAVPEGIAARIRSATQSQVVAALTHTLVGRDGPLPVCVAPAARRKHSAEETAG